jgi:hypothetical protein
LTFNHGGSFLAKETLDIPAELARREKRIESLKHARQIIEAQAKEMAATKQAEHQAKVAERQAQRDAGKKPRGPEPKAPDDQSDGKDQYNFTDRESRIMKAGNGKHFEQAYNAQAVVDEAMMIVGQPKMPNPSSYCMFPSSNPIPVLIAHTFPLLTATRHLASFCLQS